MINRNKPPLDVALLPETTGYTDGAQYDLHYGGVDETELLLDLARITGGLVLDLACGTGRTSLPLAWDGIAVAGVDASLPMLEQFRQKADSSGLSVQLFHQDVRELELPLTAGMAMMTGNAFQEFFTNADQDGLLGGVAMHLQPGGLFVFDTRFPSKDNLYKPRGEQPWNVIDDEQGNTITSTVIWSYDPLTQVQQYEMIDRTHDRAGVLLKTERSHNALRFTAPLELERLLMQHGFVLDAMYSDWQRTPMSAAASEMVVIARKA